MKHKNDPKTMLTISKSMSAFAKSMREEARGIGNIPNEIGRDHPNVHEFYSEAANKTYAASAFEHFSKMLENEAMAKLKPNRKCRSCGGKASVCYPRHLEGKSCA